MKTGKLLRTLHGHVEGVNRFGFSPDGKWLAVGSGGHTRDGKGPGAVRVWDLEKNEIVVHLK